MQERRNKSHCLEGLLLMETLDKFCISKNFIWAASKDWEKKVRIVVQDPSELLLHPCLLPPLSPPCFSYSCQLGHALYTSSDIFMVWSSPICWGSVHKVKLISKNTVRPLPRNCWDRQLHLCFLCVLCTLYRLVAAYAFWWCSITQDGCLGLSSTSCVQWN